jgi:hypothetical protein
MGEPNRLPHRISGRLRRLTVAKQLEQVGLVAFGLIMFMPVLRSAWSFAGGSDPNESNLRQALVGVILMVAFDNLLNVAMILPYLLLMGGLTTRRALELPGSSDPGKMAVFGGNRARQGRAVEAILQEAGPDTPIAYLDDD